MALDGAFLACLRQELGLRLADARIDKIHQPGKEELVLFLRRREGNEKLYISARADAPRIHLIGQALENPASPPMFCMLLRKRMTGGRLAGLRQEGFERALYLDFDCTDELGDPVRLTLAVEIMGRHSNIILLDGEGRVIDAIKRVDAGMSSVRPVLPGLMYAPPPQAAGKLDFALTDPAAIVEAVCRGKPEKLADALLGHIAGLSPVVCRELEHLVLKGRDRMNTELTADDLDKLNFYLKRLRIAVEIPAASTAGGENRIPYGIFAPDGKPIDYSFYLITQYGLAARGREFGSFSELLETFYAERDAAERLRRRASDILRLLTNLSDRTARKLASQREELEQSGRREERRRFGDLITANLHIIPKGAASADLTDYSDPMGGTVRVPLDPALTAAQNAQKYYKIYRKAKTAERVLAEQITAGEAELAYFDTVFDALSRAETYGELSELREELSAGGYLRLQKGKQKPPPPVGSMAFTSEDGFRILAGRNNLQNDRLTLKTAKGSDLWFHVKNIPGSHTVICCEGETPPDRTVEQAAVIAATYSKASNSTQVPVDYTYIRHVRKAAGAKPGMVIYDSQKTVYVKPDLALAARLKK